MGSENDGGPAFPSGDGVHAAGPCHHYGITVREYAAIHLRVPNSGPVPVMMRTIPSTITTINSISIGGITPFLRLCRG